MELEEDLLLQDDDQVQHEDEGANYPKLPVDVVMHDLV